MKCRDETGEKKAWGILYTESRCHVDPEARHQTPVALEKMKSEKRKKEKDRKEQWNMI
jgi:hypothetical protein